MLCDDVQRRATFSAAYRAARLSRVVRRSPDYPAAKARVRVESFVRCHSTHACVGRTHSNTAHPRDDHPCI